MDRDWCLLARWWRNEILRYSQLLEGDWTGSGRHRFWGLPDVAQPPGSERLEETCPRNRGSEYGCGTGSTNSCPPSVSSDLLAVAYRSRHSRYCLATCETALSRLCLRPSKPNRR